jgi:hypothetical protein
MMVGAFLCKIKKLKEYHGRHGVNHVGIHTSPEPQVVQGGNNEMHRI